MQTTQELAQRIDTVLGSLEGERKRIQETETREHRERQARLVKLEEVFESLVNAIKPRLELLIQRFGNMVVANPNIKQTTQEIVLNFRCELAGISLRFGGTTDRDVRKVILSYDLSIVPALMQFDSHATLEMPLDAVDLEAAVRWTDERIISFVHTYLQLHQNQYYLRDQMAVDPVTGASFPKFAAAAKLERDGRTFYFVSEENRRAFEQARQQPGKAGR